MDDFPFKLFNGCVKYSVGLLGLTGLATAATFVADQEGATIIDKLISTSLQDPELLADNIYFATSVAIPSLFMGWKANRNLEDMALARTGEDLEVEDARNQGRRNAQEYEDSHAAVKMGYAVFGGAMQSISTTFSPLTKLLSRDCFLPRKISEQHKAENEEFPILYRTGELMGYAAQVSILVDTFIAPLVNNS